MRQLMAIFNMVDGAVLFFYGLVGYFFSGLTGLLLVCVFAIFNIVAGVKLSSNQHSGYIMTIIARVLESITIPMFPISFAYDVTLNSGIFIPLAPIFPKIISSKEVEINTVAVALLLFAIGLYISYRRKIKSDMKSQ